jgi:hypothetical protein
MSKYASLAAHLGSLPTDSWTARFSEVEQVLGFSLPNSARTHRPWWANQSTVGHSQTQGWMAAGWLTEAVSLETETVTFVRKANSRMRQHPAARPGTTDAPAAKTGDGLSIAQAKVELSRYYDTAAENIEIIIRG